MESMRIEKSYRMIGMDLAREYSLLEAGLPRFINFDKEFPGKDALLKQQEQGLPLNYVTLEVDVTDADPLGSEPIFHNGTMIGRGTSGAYGHTVEKSLSLGYVPPEYAPVGTELEVEILGERRPDRAVAGFHHRTSENIEGKRRKQCSVPVLVNPPLTIEN